MWIDCVHVADERSNSTLYNWAETLKIMATLTDNKQEALILQVRAEQKIRFVFAIKFNRKLSFCSSKSLLMKREFYALDNLGLLYSHKAKSLHALGRVQVKQTL
jgi:hypothetical protein